MSEKLDSTNSEDVAAEIGRLITRARAAQAEFETYSQERVDDVAAAAAWAIYEPERARELAELSVQATGLAVSRQDHQESAQNHRHLARPDGSAIGRGHRRAHGTPASPSTPSRRCGGGRVSLHQSRRNAGEQDDDGSQGRQCRDPFAIAQGCLHVCAVGRYIHEELDKVGAPRDLVQFIAEPSKALTNELMRQADLVVVTGSQRNVRAAYSSGTPAIGVGAGNAAGDHRCRREPRRCRR